MISLNKSFASSRPTFPVEEAKEFIIVFAFSRLSTITSKNSSAISTQQLKGSDQTVGSVIRSTYPNLFPQRTHPEWFAILYSSRSKRLTPVTALVPPHMCTNPSIDQGHRHIL